jgi:hypothetical protein
VHGALHLCGAPCTTAVRCTVHYSCSAPCTTAVRCTVHYSCAVHRALQLCGAPCTTALRCTVHYSCAVHRALQLCGTHHTAVVHHSSVVHRAQLAQQVREGRLLGATGRSGPPWGGISARNVFLWRSVLYGAFVWACRAPNRPKRRVPGQAVQCEACPAGRFSEFGTEACLECTMRPGLGRVIALHCRPSALYRIRKHIRCPYV